MSRVFLRESTTVLYKLYICMELDESHEVVRGESSDEIPNVLIRPFTSCP